MGKRLIKNSFEKSAGIKESLTGVLRWYGRQRELVNEAARQASGQPEIEDTVMKIFAKNPTLLEKFPFFQQRLGITPGTIVPNKDVVSDSFLKGMTAVKNDIGTILQNKDYTALESMRNRFENTTLKNYADNVVLKKIKDLKEKGWADSTLPKEDVEKILKARSAEAEEEILNYLFANPEYKETINALVPHRSPKHDLQLINQMKDFQAKLERKGSLQKVPPINYPLVGAVVAGGYGVSKITDMMQNKKKQKGFLQMMEATPALENFDKVETMKYYNTLYDVNPEMALQPVVAGSFVHSHLQAGVGVPASAAAELLKAKIEREKAKGTKQKGLGGRVLDSVIFSTVGLDPSTGMYNPKMGKED